MPRRVCSTDTLYHYLFSPDPDAVASILKNGLHPLSDFPDSPRWVQIQNVYPGFFEWLYGKFAEPVLKRPYTNSGIFLSPIDFRCMPDSLMYDKLRIEVPLERIDPVWAALSYVIDDQRLSFPLSPDTLEATAEIWTEDKVTRWFGVDTSRLFFYVPQVVTYQPGGIQVDEGDIKESS